MSRSRADRRPRLFPLLLALATLAGACASAGEPMSEIAAEINATLDPSPTRFMPGDTVDVRFPKDQTLNQAVVVDQEGSVSFLKLKERVKVLGKTPAQVEGELESAYRGVLTDNDLSVNLIGVNPDTDVATTNRPIHLLGEVRAPGSIPFLGKKLTLIEALARAGSFDKRSALLKQVLLVRWMPEEGPEGSYRAWKIDARPDQWEGPIPILLQAHDVVFVPQKPIDKVDIWIDQYIRQLIPFPYLIPPIY